MITVNIPRDQQIFVKVPLMAGKIRQRVSAAVHMLAVELQSYVVKNKLSGQVLNKRSGHLQQSIQQQVTESSTEITGKVFSAGDVKYAAIHEYGGTIPAHIVEAKNASCLAFMWQGKMSFFKSVQIPDVHMPERSYLRSSLDDNKQHIIDTLQEAAVMAVKE